MLGKLNADLETFRVKQCNAKFADGNTVTGVQMFLYALLNKCKSGVFYFQKIHTCLKGLYWYLRGTY